MFRVKKMSRYIKMNRRSLVSLKLKNGSTDLNNYFFISFALLQGWFKKIFFLKNRKSCPENWKIREKLKVLFLWERLERFGKIFF
jgi:hypothetical protein